MTIQIVSNDEFRKRYQEARIAKRRRGFLYSTIYLALTGAAVWYGIWRIFQS